jgi:hypothetical protein
MMLYFARSSFLNKLDRHSDMFELWSVRPPDVVSELKITVTALHLLGYWLAIDGLVVGTHF